ncbi:MAG: right-handed parallel beta-helix repeat-containing protein, partial [Bacteroidales bacterium]|nr:right-handed parallel beta-helix repeat-containing protein [Bacteroidales bacterium]
GGVIYVYNGIYYENISINKRIELLGEDKDSTIIDGQNLNDVINISNDSISISGFNIINSLDYGIKINSNANSVIGNNFSSHEEEAIYLFMVESNHIAENNFNDNSGGIKLDQSNHNSIENNAFYHGSLNLYLSCNYNEISGNTIQNYGRLELSGSFYNIIIENVLSSCWGSRFDHSEHNVIVGNIITNCETAIDFHACNYNTIIENTISGNIDVGIILPDCMCGGCNNNQIYHNNWINNKLHAADGCSNSWHDDYPSGGNFWDDYSGVDNFSGPNQNIPGSDSIGDTPYYINGIVQDPYPLMFPFGFPPLADEVYVDDNFDENTPGWGYDHFDLIYQGINLVNRGGIVNVANGTYFETIFINKKITLMGNYKDSVIIDGMGQHKIIYNMADSVALSGLTVRNGAYFSQAVTFNDAEYCFLTQCKIENCYDGIWCGNANHMKITSITVSDCDGTGFILGSNSCLISGNTFQNNWRGVIIVASGTKFSGNNVMDNFGQGGVSIYNADSNLIISNTISNNTGYGIRLYNSSDNNTLKGNRIENNSEYGIKLFDNSSNNIIYHNILNDNLPANAYDECSNTWHSGYELPFNPWFGGGNFYGDYSGTDEFRGPWQNIPGSDGIGDEAYTILGNNGNYDPYPFMNEYGWHIRLWDEVLAEGGYNPGNTDTVFNYKKGQSLEHGLFFENTLFFKVFPNPGKNQIFINGIDTEYNFDLKLYSLQGNEIFSSNDNTGELEVNTLQLPAGLYFYLITCENGYSQSGKWIKE